MAEYSDEFYETYEAGVRRSASVIVPLIMDLLSPGSVVDVGCGTGGWLAEVRAQGVEDILGLDGHWLPVDRLKIPQEQFSFIDLLSPGDPVRRFDVALCLEVAEHLEEEAASGLVQYLTATAPFVVFSAAVPGQGGSGHLNEQWLGYWDVLFSSHGYSLYDPIRASVWDNPDVEPWYAQNLVVFADSQIDPIEVRKLAIAHGKNFIPVRAIHPLLRASVYRDQEFVVRGGS